MYTQSVEEAVEAFQTRRNLEPDGIVGPATLRELREEVEGGVVAPAQELGSRTLRIGMTGADVTQLMRLLIQRGYLTSRVLDPIETFTPDVEAAVRRFQRTYGLEPDDGVANVTMIRRLQGL